MKLSLITGADLRAKSGIGMDIVTRRYGGYGFAHGSLYLARDPILS